MISLLYKDYLNKTTAIFPTINTVLPIVKPIAKSIKPIFKQMYGFLVKNRANKEIKYWD